MQNVLGSPYPVQAEFEKYLDNESSLFATLFTSDGESEEGSVKAVLSVPPSISFNLIERLIMQGGRHDILVEGLHPDNHTEQEGEIRFDAVLAKILPRTLQPHS
jgi:hypothetical protein